jgi:plasmid stability protein
MGHVLIRDIEDEVIETHRRRADMAGRSLEEELRRIMRTTAKPTKEELRALTAHFHATTRGGPLEPLPRSAFRGDIYP